MLDELDTLVGLLVHQPSLLAPGRDRKAVAADSLYCAQCGDYRRVYVQVISAPSWPKEVPGQLSRVPKGARRFVPSLGTMQCVQCSTLFTWIIYRAPDGPALAVLPSTYAGITTPNTPRPVAYYLDQAHRAHAVGANTAAVAMFRAALEQLLFEQGFQTGMLSSKITALEAAIGGGAAPRWAQDLDVEFLKIIKDLGNASIHPNDGDIARQDALDADAVHDLTKLFAFLLFTVYEVPVRSASLKADLKAKAAIINKHE